MLLKLIRTLRRFFAPEAAQEIWTFFKPKLLTLHPDFQEVSSQWKLPNRRLFRTCVRNCAGPVSSPGC